MKIRLAVFDCDGTLSDGQAAVCTAMQAGFAEAGLGAPDLHQVRRIVGLSLPKAIALLAPHAPLDQQRMAIEAYKQSFRQARRDGTLQEAIFDGIPDILKALHSKGWTLGVATGKSDRGLKSTLAAAGLSNLFSTLQTADRHPSKPHPSMLNEAMEEAMARPENTVMIGDTTYDIEMAKAAGVRAIGVNWGYHEPQELRDAGAEAVAQSPSELAEMIGAQ